MAEIAQRLFPDHQIDKKMTYNMVKKIYEDQENQLRSMGIDIITDNVKLISQEGPRLILHTADKSTCLSLDRNFHIINAARTTDTSGIPKTQTTPFGDFYTRSIKEILSGGPIVILGSGLNATWALRDSPAPVIHLIPKGDQVREDLYGEKNFRASISMADKDFQLIPHPDGTVTIKGRDLKTNKDLQVRVPESNIYTSKGSFLNKSLIRSDPEKVTHVDSGAQPENLRTAVAFNGSQATRAIDMRGTVIPPGNLRATYHTIIANIRDLMSYPTHDLYAAVDHKQEWRKAVVDKLEKAGCHIEPFFFKKIFLLLKHSFESQLHH